MRLFTIATAITLSALLLDVTASSVVQLALYRGKSAGSRFATLAHHKRDGDSRSSGIINASGREYIVEIGVGTPPQLFNVTLDTGSAELWVPSVKCPKGQCPFNLFDSSKSSTFSATKNPFSIEYGLGSANGMYAKDTVTAGTISAANQTFGLVTKTEDLLDESTADDTPSNGILGIGYPGLNTVRGVQDDNPFVFNLMQSNVIPQPVFAIYLNSFSAFGESGELTLGGVDDSKHNGDIQYVPVISYTIDNGGTQANIGPEHGETANGTYLFWAVPGQGVTTKSYDGKIQDPQVFVLDTGTTLTFVPDKVAEEIVNSFTDSASLDDFQGFYRVDCDTSQSQETVEFLLSTSASTSVGTPVSISVPVSELVIPLDSKTVADASSCMFGIAPTQGAATPGGQSWVLGASVLRSVYSVYDMGQNRVGVAPAIPLSGNNNSSMPPSITTTTVAQTSTQPITTTTTGAQTTTTADGQPTKTTAEGQPTETAADGQPTTTTAEGQPTTTTAEGQPTKTTAEEGQPIQTTTDACTKDPKTTVTVTVSLTVTTGAQPTTTSTALANATATTETTAITSSASNSTSQNTNSISPVSTTQASVVTEPAPSDSNLGHDPNASSQLAWTPAHALALMVMAVVFTM